MLRIKINTLIKANKYFHSSKLKIVESIINQISKENIYLEDQYSVLKILLTLPINDKFLEDHFPNKDELNNVLKTQKELVDRIKKQIPKY